MVRKKAASDSNSSRQITWVLLTGLLAISVGGIGVRAAFVRQAQVEGVEWTEATLRLRSVAFETRRAAGEIEDGHRPRGEADAGHLPGGGQRREGGSPTDEMGSRTKTGGQAGKLDAGRLKQRVARIESAMTQLEALPGVGHVLPSASLDSWQSSIEEWRSSSVGQLGPQNIQQLRESMGQVLEEMEQTLDAADETAEADGDGYIDETVTETAGTIEQYLLALLLLFVLLNFLVVIVQTLRTKPIPRMVEESFKSSSAFLIGAATWLLGN